MILFPIIVVQRSPPKIVTMTRILAAVQPHTKGPGGIITVATLTWMVSIITANILIPGQVCSGITGKVTATPLNELRWKSNQLKTRTKCTCKAFKWHYSLNSWIKWAFYSLIMSSCATLSLIWSWDPKRFLNRWWVYITCLHRRTVRFIV